MTHRIASTWYGRATLMALHFLLLHIGLLTIPLGLPLAFASLYPLWVATGAGYSPRHDTDAKLAAARASTLTEGGVHEH